MNPVIAFLSFFILGLSFYSDAQDTIVLLSGRIIIGKNIEAGGYSVSYYGLKERSKQKRVTQKVYFHQTC